MSELLTGSALPAWVDASLFLGLLCIAVSALFLTLGRTEDFCKAGDAAAGCGQAPLPPPLVPGLPLLGSALALGAGGAAFLTRCREQVGSETADTAPVHWLPGAPRHKGFAGCCGCRAFSVA